MAAAPESVVRRALVWTGFVAVLALATVALYATREQVQQVHVVLVYLLVILGGSAYGGRALGLVLALLGFLSIDYFFQTPFGLLSVSSGLDWLVLLTFFATAMVAASLLSRAQAAAARERNRSDEVERLSRLGAELLSTGTAARALEAIAEKARDSVAADGVIVCRVARVAGELALERLIVAGPEASFADTVLSEAARQGESIALSADGTRYWFSFGRERGIASLDTASVVALIVPVRVHEQVTGVLAVARQTPLRTDGASLRLFEALSYYAAVAIERVELVAEAEHAAALRERDRVREALLASLSHDLRTPLSTIKVLAQDIATRHTPLESRLVQHAEVIEEQADRLTRLVGNLLDLTRLRSSAFPVNAEVNAAEDLIGATARQVSGALGEHELVHQADRTGPVLLGRFDFVQSQRILTNLIENAARYSPSRAPIRLAVHRDGGSLVFTVSDHGQGIPAAERERVFEPFYRAPNATADVGGVGLGLYIGRALAEAQGGSLTYQADRGGGSTFVLRVPASDDASPDVETDAEGLNPEEGHARASA